MTFSHGSEWRKWDLHVHTPNSMVNHYIGSTPEEKWEKFITDLENLPEEFKVLGINDYLFIDGYEKVLQYRQTGRLKNIETIFPVIEFRIKKFGGNNVFKRINFHIIFSDKLQPEIIKQQFLAQLYGKYKLAPGVEGIEWAGFLSPESLLDLGQKIKSSVPKEKLPEYGSDLEEGFNNINFDEEEIITILKTANTYLSGKYLTAVGKTEWDAFLWGDSSIAEKKTVINNVDFVFTSAENIDACTKAKLKLTEQGVNDTLLDCSDAHWNASSTNKDRIGKCFTWLKADPTFEGLKQVLNEKDRIFLGGTPDLLKRLALAPNKIIQQINIRRIADCSMPEVWYDNLSIPLNPGLVAIIGNKGNGKSALTDIIGLIGNSHNESYSFLTKKKFRNPRPFNKATQIEAQLIWVDSTEDGFSTLDSSIDTSKFEKVKYIPQNFLETLCVNEDEKEFENEIKKIIFSHTSITDRLGFSNLDELTTYKSEIINKDLGVIKGEIDDLNQRIINLERKGNEPYRRGLDDQLHARQEEAEKHKLLVPNEVPEPKNDPELEERNKAINEQIIQAKALITEKALRRQALETANASLSLEVAELDKSIQSFQALSKSIATVYSTQETILKKYEIDITNVFSYSLNLTPVQGIFVEKRSMLQTNNTELFGNDTVIGLEKEIVNLKKGVEVLEDRLDEPYRVYQKYLSDLEQWQLREKAILGDRLTIGTIEYLQDQIKYVDERLPQEVEQLKTQRKELLKKLFSKKSEIISLFSSSYKPISDFISQYGHLMKGYQINLSVEFTLDGFIQKFFDHISQGAKGTYIGIEEGNKYLSELIPQFNLNTEDGVIEFLNHIIDSLFIDKRTDQANTKRDIEQQLKKGYAIDDLYRFLFNLDYLKPTFKLNLGSKSLTELSPGERGALLLIFYLFLDKDDRPLIIDQPEENLDNQSVYYYLVDFIKEAKKWRQIIIVTHNPNLAVVCDAEQVIHMTIDKTNNYKVSYESGAIENPVINKLIVDILEGTKPAFSNRTNKYSLSA